MSRGNGPIIQVFTAQALPGAGAFLADASINCIGADELSVIVAYTQGAAGGAPSVRLSWTFQGRTNTPNDPGTVEGVINTGGVNLSGEEWTLVNPGASPYSRIIHVIVPPAAQTLELSLAEIGVVGTPGTVTVWVGSAASK